MVEESKEEEPEAQLKDVPQDNQTASDPFLLVY
jgi:hypothetical protein